jgi:hypothetical protein
LLFADCSSSYSLFCVNGAPSWLMSYRHPAAGALRA